MTSLGDFTIPTELLKKIAVDGFKPAIGIDPEGCHFF
jgi:hypothetical protein